MYQMAVMTIRKELEVTMQYKTVAAPKGFSVKAGKDAAANAVAQYAELIQKEAVDGWELLFIQTIPVEEQPGCLAGLFGKKATTTYYNMLVFKK